VSYRLVNWASPWNINRAVPVERRAVWTTNRPEHGVWLGGRVGWRGSTEAVRCGTALRRVVVVVVVVVERSAWASHGFVSNALDAFTHASLQASMHSNNSVRSFVRTSLPLTACVASHAVCMQCVLRLGTHAQASCVSSFHASKSTNVMRATTGVRSAQGSTRSGIRIPALYRRGLGLGHVQHCMAQL
jgi:hypothetical protein